MTTHNIHHTGTPVQPYVDEYGLGQRTLARINLELAEEALAQAAVDAYAPGYVNPKWREMKRRLADEARDDIARAKAVLS